MSTLNTIQTDFEVAILAAGFRNIEEYHSTRNKREDNYVIKRAITFWLLKSLRTFEGKGLYSLSDIGRVAFKDHATVLNAVKKINNLIDTNDREYTNYILNTKEVFNLIRHRNKNEAPPTIQLRIISDAVVRGFEINPTLSFFEVYNEAFDFLVNLNMNVITDYQQQDQSIDYEQV